MCQHFLHPHLTLGKPIFHPGHSSFQIQTGIYFTSAEKTWFTKIRPRKFQTNIQSVCSGLGGFDWFMIFLKFMGDGIGGLDWLG